MNITFKEFKNTKMSQNVSGRSHCLKSCLSEGPGGQVPPCPTFHSLSHKDQLACSPSSSGWQRSSGWQEKLVKAKPATMQWRLEPLEPSKSPRFVQPKIVFVCFFHFFQFNNLYMHIYVYVRTSKFMEWNCSFGLCHVLLLVQTEHSHSSPTLSMEIGVCNGWQCSAEVCRIQRLTTWRFPHYPTVQTESSGNVSR